MNIKGDAPWLQPLLPCKFDNASFWSSPEKLARFVEEQGRDKAWYDCAWSTEDPEWSGSKSMDHTLSMAKSGWPEGAERVSRIRDYVNATNPIRKNPIRYGFAGSVPSVPRAVAGDPKSMRLPTDSKNKRKPVITLIHNMGAYSYVTADAINNRSAVVAAVIDQIEAAGFSVEVLAISPCTGWGVKSAYPSPIYGEAWRMCTTVLIKPSDQPTDIGRLAFGLGQASMFRRLAFADRTLEPVCQKPLGSSMGSTMQLTPNPELTWKHVYLLPSNNVKLELFKDPAVAADQGSKWLINELKKQRCPAFPGEAVKNKDDDDEEDGLKIRLKSLGWW